MLAVVLELLPNPVPAIGFPALLNRKRIKFRRPFGAGGSRTLGVSS